MTNSNEISSVFVASPHFRAVSVLRSADATESVATLEQLITAMRSRGWPIFSSCEDQAFAHLELERDPALEFLDLMAGNFPLPDLGMTVLPSIREGADVYQSLIPERWTISTNYFDLMEDHDGCPWSHISPRQRLASITIIFPRQVLNKVVAVVRNADQTLPQFSLAA